MKRLILSVSLMLVMQAALAEGPKDHVVDQKDKQFSVADLNARIGDTVTFRNNDSVSHNIFSLSDAQSFDLGTYANGQSRSLKLEGEGVIEVECAVHPSMKMQIKVTK